MILELDHLQNLEEINCALYTGPRCIKKRENLEDLKKLLDLTHQGYASGYKIDEWIPIKPETDLAFFLGVAHYLLSYDLIDKSYLKKYTMHHFLLYRRKETRRDTSLGIKTERNLFGTKLRENLCLTILLRIQNCFFKVTLILQL